MGLHDNKAYEVSPGDEGSKWEPPAANSTAASGKFAEANQENDHAYASSAVGPEATAVDPWAAPELAVVTTPWREMDARGRIKFIVWDCVFRQVAILGFLYVFICSLDFLSSSFRLVGGKALNEVFTNNGVLSNPITGVMIGVLATVLLQSSSTTTSIVVAMVGSDSISIKLAIPIIMGANIGTSVTNTLVSLGQVKKRDDFRRAFGGATVHDMFNWLTVIVLLPIEVATGYLAVTTNFTISSFQLQQNKDADVKFLSVITEPLTKLVIQLDRDKLIQIATCTNCSGIVLAKKCPFDKAFKSLNVTYEYFNATLNENVTYVNVTKMSYDTDKRSCEYLFADVAGVWADEVIGAILLAASIVLLCACLIGLVKILQSTLKGTVAKVLKKIVGLNIPSSAGAYATGYIYIVIGTVFTILLQSSSVFTSALTPLVGLGVLPIERAYALTLGSNVGTTATAILAALAGSNLAKTLQISLCHLYFNVTGIVLWYVVPKLRFPIPLAKKLGDITAKYRWFSIAYLLGMFLLLPGAVFALSIPGWQVLAGVGGPIVLVLVAVAIVNLMQSKRPNLLPSRLRTWEFLPLPLHSLKPIDRVIVSCCTCCRLEDVEQGSSSSSGDSEDMKGLEMIATAGSGGSSPNGQTTPPPPYSAPAFLPQTFES